MFLGIKLLMLGISPLLREDKSIIDLFFSEYFLVAIPIGLMQYASNGEVRKGPIKYPLSNSFWIRASTTPGSFKTYNKFTHMWIPGGRKLRPAKNPCMSPFRRKLTNHLLGWEDKFLESSWTLMDMEGCLFIFLRTGLEVLWTCEGKQLWGDYRHK